MPFSSLTDPVELARAAAALEAAWNDLRSTHTEPVDERERTRLAYIVSNLVRIAQDENDLARRAVALYRRSS